MLLAVAMVWIGNNFSLQKFLDAWKANFSFLGGNSNIGQLLMAILIIILVAIAFAIGTGHKIGPGAIMVVIVLLVAIGVINLWNSGYFQNVGQYIQQKGIWFALGKALSDFTGGLAAGKAGMAIGFGCLAIGIILVIIPNFSTPIGIILIIIGCGIVGTAMWDDWIKPWLDDLTGRNGPQRQGKAIGHGMLVFGGGGGISAIGILIKKLFTR